MWAPHRGRTERKQVAVLLGQGPKTRLRLNKIQKVLGQFPAPVLAYLPLPWVASWLLQEFPCSCLPQSLSIGLPGLLQASITISALLGPALPHLPCYGFLS